MPNKKWGTHEEMIERLKIKKLTSEGHTYHCACRQVWGDGECECRRDKRGNKKLETVHEVKMLLKAKEVQDDHRD